MSVPTRDGEPLLILVTEQGEYGPGGSFAIGLAQALGLAIPELFADVSETHAQIVIGEGGLQIKDMSEKGTWLNGKRLDRGKAWEFSPRRNEIRLGGPEGAIVWFIPLQDGAGILRLRVVVVQPEDWELVLAVEEKLGLGWIPSDPSPALARARTSFEFFEAAGFPAEGTDGMTTLSYLWALYEPFRAGRLRRRS
jgi:FHA domain